MNCYQIENALNCSNISIEDIAVKNSVTHLGIQITKDVNTKKQEGLPRKAYTAQYLCGYAHL